MTGLQGWSHRLADRQFLARGVSHRRFNCHTPLAGSVLKGDDDG